MLTAPLSALDRISGPQPSAPAGPSATAQVDASAAPPLTGEPDALEGALQSAAALQGGLNALFADLAAASDAGLLAPQVQAIADAVLGAALPLDPPPSPEALKVAAALSGVFYEARLADGGAAPPTDLKGLLLQLRDVLPAAGPTPGAPPPAPPYPDGPQTAQPALTAAVEAFMSPAAFAARLARRATGALSRQVLMQAASAGVGPRTTDRNQARTWLFELPLATPEGAAVAQFEVEADGEGPEAGARRSWRTRFTFDVAPIGPVHARISHSAGQTRIALWVEDEAMLARLSARRGELDAMLAEAELPSQVALLPGAPAGTTPPPPPGRFVAACA
jgi:hypothetical protein